jgi:phosphate transport system protein
MPPECSRATRFLGTCTSSTIDFALTELVIADDLEMTARCYATLRRCVTLLALQAPVAADLRIVVVAMRAANDLKRMGNLAHHIAKVVRLGHGGVIAP